MVVLEVFRTGNGGERERGEGMGVSAGQPTQRERIITATLDLLGEQPLSTLTTREIALRAGVQHSLIARYFGSKEALLREIALRTGSGYAKAVADAKDPVDGFVRGLDYFLDVPARAAVWIEPILYNVAASLPSSHPAMTIHLAQLALEGDEPPEAAYEDEDHEPDPGSDPRLVVMAALAFMGGWTVMEEFAMAAHLSSYEREDIRREVRRMLTDLVRRELAAGRPRANGTSP
jgi:AcrR family transcriptional regulator